MPLFIVRHDLRPTTPLLFLAGIPAVLTTAVASIWLVASGCKGPRGPLALPKLRVSDRRLASVLFFLGVLAPAKCVPLSVTGPCVVPTLNNCVASSSYQGGADIGSTGGYANSKDCEIIGFAAVAISVNNFDVEAHPTCDYDYLVRRSLCAVAHPHLLPFSICTSPSPHSPLPPSPEATPPKSPARFNSGATCRLRR